MQLEKLIDVLKPLEIKNYDKKIDIKGISYNSQLTKAGDIFVCLKGEYSDGHNWAKMAKDRGALALLCERALEVELPQLIVESTRQKIADVAALLCEYPTENLNLIGVTGTNGKTTVTHLLQKIFEKNSQKCALIGTLGHKLSSNDTYHDAKHTTPQAPELQAVMKKIKDNDINNVVMEVSSHALEQNRVGRCFFKGAVLTNLTQDHLDYHITMDNYFDAKSILFKNLKEGNFAIINADDEYAKRFENVVPVGVKVLTYGIKNQADIMAKNIEFSTLGVKFDFVYGEKSQKIQLKMNGIFSVYNALAALGAAIGTGLNLEKSIEILEETAGVAGRFEIVNNHPMVIVDYAHTPDGLENVLKTAREITPHNGKLICIFGCGGDRDATKRPKMGAIADKLSDKIIITSDNPRSEDPQQIISDILTGIQSINPNRVFVEEDRGIAISMIKNIAGENDVVMLAGKGHEDYQILKDKTIHFDDREEVRMLFDEKNGGNKNG